MLRNKIISSVKAYGGALCPLLVLLGFAIILYLPNVKQPGNYIDENAIGHRGEHVELLVDAEPFLLSAEYEWPSRLVRGTRSPGTEVIAIYVNTEHNASIQLANIVTASLRKENNNLSCDIQFYFVNNEEEWPIPQSYARAALVLNISTLRNSFMCLDMYGRHGLQPNRDLVNTVLHHAQRINQEVSLLCQTNKAYRVKKLSPLQYCLASMLEAIRLPLFPQRWHEIPTWGIGTVALSSDPQYREVEDPRVGKKGQPTSTTGNPEDKYAYLLLQTIFSLNSLEERFHHASNVYLPIDRHQSVPYEVAQFALFGFITSVVSAGYAYYQLEGFSFNLPIAAGLCLTTPIAAQVQKHFGWIAFVALSVAFVVLLYPATWNTTWMSILAAVLVMMESLQPATGLLCGAGIAIEGMFLHPAVAYFPGYLFIGTALSWLIWSFFIFYVELPIWSTDGISVGVISLLVYPNTLWVTSRFLRSFFLRRSLNAASAQSARETAVAEKKKKQ